MNRSSHHPIARTALASDRTSLTVRPAGSIPVAHLHVPLFFPLITQYFSLRTPITFAHLIVHTLLSVILRPHPTPFIGTLPLARLIHTGPMNSIPRSFIATILSRLTNPPSVTTC